MTEVTSILVNGYKDIYFNVCVEKNNYKPWDFEVIKKRLEVKN